MDLLTYLRKLLVCYIT